MYMESAEYESIPVTCLTLYHTIPTCNDPEKEAFLKTS